MQSIAWAKAMPTVSTTRNQGLGHFCLTTTSERTPPVNRPHASDAENTETALAEGTCSPLRESVISPKFVVRTTPPENRAKTANQRNQASRRIIICNGPPAQ